jgi:hypothetical protein
VAHKSLERDEIPVAFTDEAVCEAVPQLVGGEEPHTCAFTDAPRESPERLL